MSAHSPDDRLSAFYDGELSAAERAEVERLLTERADLRSELSGMTDLSQRLGELADDVPEFDLRPPLLERIAHTQRASSAPRASTPPTARRRWMPALLAICSLGLLVAVVLPLLSQPKQADLVAINDASTHHGAKDRAEPAIPAASGPAETVAALAEGPFNAPALASDSPAPAMSAVASDNATGSSEAAAAPADSPDGTGPSEVLNRLAHDGDLRPGKIFQQLAMSGDVPLVAEYTVVDVQGSSQQLEVLLQTNGIEPLIPSDKADSAHGENRSAKSLAVSETRVYIVDAEAQSVNTAILGCSQLQEVVYSNVEPLEMTPVEVAEMNSQNGGTAKEMESPSSSAAASLREGLPAESPALDVTPRKPKSAVVGSPAGDGLKVSQAEKKAPAEQEGRQGAAEGSLMMSNNSLSDSKRKFAHLVNGNSLVIENGEAVCAELQQRQGQQLKNAYAVRGGQRAAPQSPAPQNNQPLAGIDHKQGSSADSISRNSPTQNSGAYTQGGGFGGNGMQYGNSAYGGRSRQRAILVLRTQAPPPPPGAEPIGP